MPLPVAVEKLLQDADKKLHEENEVTKFLAVIETKTGIKRLHFVIGLLALHAAYLVFGSSAELLCNTIGFMYPAYMSIIAIESSRKDDDTQWLTYWAMFALLNIIEFFSDIFVTYFPIYWLIKCIFLLYLYLPMTLGAQKVYARLIHPLAQKHKSLFEKQVGRVVDKVTEKIGSVAQEFEQHVKPN